MFPATGPSLLSKRLDVWPLTADTQQLGIDPHPLIVAPDTLLRDAIAQMSQASACSLAPSDQTSQPNQRCSYALVMNQHMLLGILTNRDLVKLTAEGVCFDETTVLRVMSSDVITLKASDIKDAFTPLNLMRQYRIRHLPIVNEQHTVCGIITATRLRQALPASALLKRQQVKEIMATQVITAPPSTPVLDVAKLMGTHHISCVVIQQSPSHPPLGIITEYDIIQLQRLELDLQTLIAKTVMSSPLICLHPEDQLGVVQTKMQQLHVQRLVVVDAQGHLAGLVTQTSILSVLDPQEMATTIDLLQQQIEQLQDEHIQLLQNRNATLETQMQSSETSRLVCEEKFQATFEQAAVGIAHLDLDGTLIALNQRFGDILGYQPAELLQRSLLEFIHLDDLNDQKIGLNAITSLLQRTQSSFAQEKRYYRKDGSLLWGNTTVSMVTQPGGNPDYLIVVLEDICDRKQAQIDLQQLNQELEARVTQRTSECQASERRYRMLFESAPDLLFVLNIQGEIQTVNSAVTKRLGYTDTDLKGRLLSDFLIIESQNHFQQVLEFLLEQGSHRQEMELRSQQGTSLCVDCACSVIVDTPDQVPYILVIQRDISDQKRLESRLRSSEQQMRAVFEAMHDVVFLCTLQKGVITGINLAPTTPTHKGKCVDDLADHTLQYLWDHAETAAGQSMQQVLDTGETLQFEYHLTISGQTLWFLAHISAISDQTILWVARDISDLKQAEKALFQEKELAQVTLQSIGDAVITTDRQGCIYKFNPVAEHLTGWKTAETQGRPLSDVFNIIHEDTRKPAENPINKALQEEAVVALAKHTVLVARDGTEYAIEDSAAPIRNRDGQVIGAVIVFHDVTQARNLTRQLSWQASHDPLTRLANRRKFDQILLVALQSARSHQQHHVLCFLDLDQFKVINDTCGHAAGDDLLCQVSKRLQQSIRVTDTLARLGGDEFAILFSQCPLGRAIVIAENILKAIQNFRFSWHQETFKIGVSIGLVTIDQYSPELETIMGAADAACYTAKAKGRNRIQIYQGNNATLLQQRGEQQWSLRIKQALANDRLSLYSQVIIPTAKPSQATGHICEIFLRLITPDNEVITADEFMPAAERYNLATKIDRWVIGKFLSVYTSNYHSGPPSPLPQTQYMINLSGASIGDQPFLDFLKQQFKQYPDAAQQICFEITETAAISNLSHSVYFMKELKQLGCKFALDDFGAGISSFTHLKNLPADYLKIDGHIFSEMADDLATYTIVESINHIGHVMGMQTIAECVSSASIRDKFLDIGVDYVQGFTISPPQEWSQF